MPDTDPSEVQTLTPRYLCGCGAFATTMVQFPYEQPGFFCGAHIGHVRLSKEPEPGRVYQASVTQLDGSGTPVVEVAKPTYEQLAAENASLRELLEADTAPQFEESSRVD